MTYTDAQKKIIDSDSSNVSVMLYFVGNDGFWEQIDNSSIYSESLSLEESLYEGDEITFGKCNASCFKIKIANNDNDYVGGNLQVYLTFKNSDGNVTVQLGNYTVFSAERTADRMFKEIVAYDYMTKFDVDITKWYNETLYPKQTDAEGKTYYNKKTVKEILQMLCGKVGVTLSDNIPMVNGFLEVGKTIEPTSLSGRDLLQSICEINGAFGHINENGRLELIRLNREDLLYPAETLYPSDSLFPKSGFFDAPDDIKVYKSCDYKDYETSKFDSVSIRMEDDDIGVTYSAKGKTNNMYTVMANPLTFGLEQDILNNVAKNLYDVVSGLYFQPCNTVVSKGLYIELGNPYDIFVVQPTEREVYTAQLTSYVMRRELNGIQAISSTFISEGTKDVKPYVSPLNSEYKQLQGKYNKLAVDLNGFHEEVGDIAQGLNTKIDITAEGINAQMTDLNNNLRGEIEASASGLRTEFSADYVSKDYLEGMGVISQNLLIGTDLNNDQFNKYYSKTWGDSGSFSINNDEGSVTITNAMLGFESNNPRLNIAEDHYVISFEVLDTNIPNDNFWFFSLYLSDADGNEETLFTSKYASIGKFVFRFDSSDLEDRRKNIFKRVEIDSTRGMIKIGKIKLEKGDFATDWVASSSDSPKGQIDALRIELNSKVEQTAENITSTVSRNQTKWDVGTDTISYYGYGSPVDYLGAAEEKWLNKTYLNVEDGNLYLCQVNNNVYTWRFVKQYNSIQDNLSSRIDQTADSIALEVEARKSDVEELSSNIEMTASEITLEVEARRKDVDTLSSRISVTESGISSKVSKGDVVSEINQSPDQITLDSNRLVVNSTNFKLDRQGNMTANNGNFTGTVNATSLTANDNVKLKYNNIIKTVISYLKGGDNLPLIRIGASDTNMEILCKELECSSKADIGGVLLENENVNLEMDKGIYSTYTGWILRPYTYSSTRVNALGNNSYPTRIYGSSTWMNKQPTYGSDERIKKDFGSLEKYEDLFMDLKPLSFKYKDDDKDIHFGVKAQDVKNSMDELDIDGIALFSEQPTDKEIYPYIDTDTIYNIAYGEMTMLNTHMIQKAYQKIEEQQNEIETLKEQVSFLMSKLGGKE